MNRVKRVAFTLLLVLIGIQLIQPARNKSGQVLSTDFAKIYVVPGNVQTILQNACYDCHSNNTHYPWYSRMQPIAWIMARHIKNGKEQLNFSVFGGYSLRRQISKLKSIANQVKDDAMPISSYKIMHGSASLTEEDKALIENWMNKTADSLSANN
jgi:uncharacterized membrane protein